MEEEIKESYLDSDISFLPHSIKDLKQLLKIRRANLEITQMIWLKKRAVIASWGELYNPKSLIMIFLN